MTTPSPRWFTSSYSSNGGNCVEVATNLAATHGIVPVRDSKDPLAGQLTLSPAAFAGLVALARRGCVQA
ncbi:DUF397 domain-containing protein [Streptomyces liangshanensis]|uniref:DUF397 domain-containing protein n=1 Tax=Streptomyces liangshanensis TaxID=2717324 RepID=A0A6G9H2H8_9ACTN|nr:DUF397 domain-containing protein [Streptomyces liangshanensis]QIQ04526.1 DUF397 domain-containing protein [Streptomyces liangshanensis]